MTADIYSHITRDVGQAAASQVANVILAGVP